MAQRVNVRAAAARLGISEGAVRQRIARGSLRSEKDEDGSVYVVLSDDVHVDTDESTTGDTQEGERLIEILRDQNEFLRQQLDQEREANRENRRLLAAALERIPELEAPREARESPETPSEEPAGGTPPPAEGPPRRRSWWREFFGLE